LHAPLRQLAARYNNAAPSADYSLIPILDILGMMPPGPQPPVSQAQFVHHPPQMAPPPHAMPEQRMKARRPNDRCLPDGIEDTTVDPEFVATYNEARELERRLDATITRKRLDLAQPITSHPKVRTCSWPSIVVVVVLFG